VFFATIIDLHKKKALSLPIVKELSLLKNG